MTQLPIEGRRGPCPEWPFATVTLREHKCWRDLWESPQAVMWEKYGWEREVAFYARLSVEAEDGDMRALKEMLAVGDRLGRSPLAMMRLRWELARDEVTERRVSTSSAPKVKRVLAVDKSA